MKKFGLMIALILNLLISSLFVGAAVSTDYFIDNVEIDGVFSVPSSTTRAVTVERGQVLPVEVWVGGINNVDSVRVEVSLRGYEHRTIRYDSDIFEVDPNTVKKVPLVLELPEDLDASETYSLKIEVSDKTNSISEEHFLRVKESRHLLNIQDVIFRPSSTVSAGRFLRTIVRVENLGAKEEKDIKVSVSIPELGVSAREYVDKLVILDEEEDEEVSSISTNEIQLEIPSDAREGDYEVRVDVEYNRGNDVITARKVIHVEGEKEEKGEADTIISIDSATTTLPKNEDSVYRLMFANLGDKRSLYNVDVVGTETWADVSTEPGFLSVGASETGELLVKVRPRDDALLGPKIFTLKISSDNKPLKEINLNVGVIEGKLNLGGLGTALEILFAILIVVLIVLALVIAFRKIKSGSEGPGVETNSEQTYY